jgi:hypothetical protein
MGMSELAQKPATQIWSLEILGVNPLLETLVIKKCLQYENALEKRIHNNFQMVVNP